MVNVPGLKQSAAMAMLEKAVSGADFRFVCEMETKSNFSAEETNRLNLIVQRVNRWYFS